ncbi:MAG: TolB family protein [Patescibacteria group bacterium]
MELKHKSFFILVAIVIGIGIGILLWNFLGPVLAKGVFYYKVEGDKANLFLLKNSTTKQITSVSAREIDPGDFRPPKRSYISHNRKILIYFKQVEEVPLENQESSEFTAFRIIYEPTLVNLKNKEEKKINQSIDSASLVFSPDDSQIAWIKQIDESTYQDIETSGKKRELWLSKIDGEEAKLLVSFDENLILLKIWDGDYIYFQGLWDITNRSMGRINVKTKEIENMVPRYCEKFLENCKNIEFSPTGNRFLYEISTKKDDKDITELYLGDFNKKEFLEILTTDQISDRLWLSDGERFFYTEQGLVKRGDGTAEMDVKETIHLVDIENQIDDKIYSGSYISQLTLDAGKRYLYFLEKEKESENFKLNRLDLKTKEIKTILTDNYNKILLIQ